MVLLAALCADHGSVYTCHGKCKGTSGPSPEPREKLCSVLFPSGAAPCPSPSERVPCTLPAACENASGGIPLAETSHRLAPFPEQAGGLAGRSWSVWPARVGRASRSRACGAKAGRGPEGLRGASQEHRTPPSAAPRGHLGVSAAGPAASDLERGPCGTEAPRPSWTDVLFCPSHARLPRPPGEPAGAPGRQDEA